MKKARHFGIQFKVGGILSLVLAAAFGASVLLSTMNTLDTLETSGGKFIETLHRLGHERAGNVFTSLETAARGSLERGEMEVFADTLAELGRIPGVKEIGLTDSKGKVVYSNRPDALDTSFDPEILAQAVAAGEHPAEKILDQSMVLARAHWMEGDCIRCHIKARQGDLAGTLFVRYDMADLVAVEQIMAAEMNQAGQSAAMVGAANGLTGLVAAILVVFLMLGRMVCKPLARVGQAMEEMAEGRAVQRLNLMQTDEIGRLADTMDSLAGTMETEVVGSLKKLANGDLTFIVTPRDDRDMLRGALQKVGQDLTVLVSQIQGSGAQIASGSALVADSSQSLSQGATEQASSLQQISASVHEMAAQTRQSAENAAKADHLAGDARSAAERGRKQMHQMLEAMRAISATGADISKIIKTIDEIAFQTNLLALNAAVEAARAGQHGKGFAVVAEEVRNLAARCSKAAQETSALIEGTVQKTRDGSDIAGQTAEAFDGIVAGIEKVSQLVGEIAAASTEQAEGIGQVNQGLGQIDQVTQQNTATAEESAAAAEELAGQAGQLRQLLQHFRLKIDRVDEGREMVKF